VTDNIFDLLVIGGGPAGYSCAIRASQYGLRVALVEANEKLGGTCLLVGCVPAKSLLFSAEVFDHAKHGATYGIENIDKGTVNWTRVVARKQAVVDKHMKELDYLMRKNKITVINGYGRLTGPAKDGVHIVDVSNAGVVQQIKTRKVAIATGSDARMIPGYQADDRILTNIEFLSMADTPKSIVIMGSGAVGVEFASVMKSFNAEVTILEMLDRIVPAEDADVSKELLRQYRKRGIKVHTSAKVDKIERTQSGIKVHFTKSGETASILEAAKALVAIGLHEPPVSAPEKQE
jgi:dihydrolipoamide dehydrogenase